MSKVKKTKDSRGSFFQLRQIFGQYPFLNLTLCFSILVVQALEIGLVRQASFFFHYACWIHISQGLQCYGRKKK